MTDDQVERLMKSNPVADGDDGKQFGIQCIGARDIVGIKLSDSGSSTAIVTATFRRKMQVFRHEDSPD
jgi:hypothetical protein